MNDPPDVDAEVLGAAADPHPEEYDHPDDLTDEEAAAGEVLYCARDTAVAQRAAASWWSSEGSAP